MFAFLFLAIFFFFSPANSVFAQNQSVSSAASAHATVAKEVSDGPVFETKFGPLTAKEIQGRTNKDEIVDGLSEKDYTVFEKYLKDGSADAMRKNEEKEGKGKILDAKNEEKEGKLIAQNQAWLEQLRGIYTLTGGKFDPKIQKQIHDALHDNTVPDFIKRELQKLLNKEDTAPSK